MATESSALAWHAAFAARSVENAYVAEVFDPQLRASGFALSAALAAIMLGTVSRELSLAVPLGRRVSPHAWVGIALAMLNAIAAPAYSLSKARARVRARALEALLAVQVFACGAFTAAYQEQPGAIDDLVWLRTALLLAFVSSLVPMRPRVCAACSIMFVLEAVVTAVLVGSAEDAPHTTSSAALLASVAVVMHVGRLRAEISARRVFRARQRDVANHAIVREALDARAAAEDSIRDVSNAVTHARGRLIRMVMHDLRSPILSIATIAETLADMPSTKMLGAADVDEHLGSLVACAELIEHIVSDMLDFERIDSGRLVLVHAPFEIGMLVRGALATFAGICAKKGVTLRVELAPELARRQLVGDMRRLLQCLNNGVSNAIKFTDPNGSVVITVDVEPSSGRLSNMPTAQSGISCDGVSRCTGNVPPGLGYDAPSWCKLTISVRDSGIGLSTDDIATLLGRDIFTQVGQGQLQGAGGTGLGLQITKQILRLHNGSTLALKSEGRGKGLTFEMSVFCAETIATPPSAVRQRLSNAQANPSGTFRRGANITFGDGIQPALCASDLTGSSSEADTSIHAGLRRHRQLANERLSRTADQDAAPTSDPSADGCRFVFAPRKLSLIGKLRAKASVVNAAQLGAPSAIRGQADTGKSVPPERAARSSESHRCSALLNSARQVSPWQHLAARQTDALPARTKADERDQAAAPSPLAMLPADLERALEDEGSFASRTRGGMARASNDSVSSAALAYTVDNRAVVERAGQRALLLREAAAGPSLNGSQAPPEPPTFPAGFRCLHVEDDRVLQRSLALRLFRRLGIECDVAEDGVQAVELVLGDEGRGMQPCTYDVVLIDNQMPRMTGAAATRALRAGGFGKLIIGMTGDPGGSPEREEFEASGLDACVDKSKDGVTFVLALLRDLAVPTHSDGEAGGGQRPFASP